MHDREMESELPEPLVSREELTGIFFVIADISTNVKRIVQLLEEDDDEEEQDPG
jgi:hypothetical protein